MSLLPVWWSVVAASTGSFDDKAIRWFRQSGESLGQIDRSYDRQEVGTHEVRERCSVVEIGWLEPNLDGLVVRGETLNPKGQRYGLVARQAGDHARHVLRVPRPHDDVVNPRQHGPVGRERDRELDLPQIVDADRSCVSLLGEKHFNEVRGDSQFLEGQVGLDSEGADILERLLGVLPTRNKIGVENALGYGREWEVLECAPHMPFWIAELEPTGHDHLENRARDHAELTSSGDCICQRPARDGNTHPTLNDAGAFYATCHGESMLREPQWIQTAFPLCCVCDPAPAGKVTRVDRDEGHASACRLIARVPRGHLNRHPARNTANTHGREWNLTDYRAPGPGFYPWRIEMENAAMSLRTTTRALVVAIEIELEDHTMGTVDFLAHPLLPGEAALDTVTTTITTQPTTTTTSQPAPDTAPTTITTQSTTTQPTTTTTLLLEPDLLFEVNTLGSVGNLPTAPTNAVFDTPVTLARLRTYHWNLGQGAPPGTIGLQGTDGTLYGPWAVTRTLEGQGGVPDAYWEVDLDLTLPAGSYQVIDADPATWAQNAETGGRGITWIWGYSP